jgi:hypothetical protein
MTGTLSSSGVSNGIMAFHEGGKTLKLEPGGEGGGMVGVKSSTISVHRLNVGSGMWSFQLILLRNVRSLKLISHTFKPDILLQALAE